MGKFKGKMGGLHGLSLGLMDSEKMLGKKQLRIDKHFDYFKPKFIGVLW